MYTSVIIFLAGISIGAFATFLIMRIWIKTQAHSVQHFQGQFADMSLNVLGKVSAQLSVQNSHLQMEAAQELGRVNSALEKVSQLVRELEQDRVVKFSELSSALHTTHKNHEALARLTGQLHSVIYQKQARGQWGERMADDILRLAGLQEGVNYHAQRTLDNSSGRPDFTFLLPKGHILNMDVKFPLENYARYVNAEDDIQKESYMSLFLTDIKNHLRSLSRREYVSVHECTLDYMLMFIPSDLIYTTIFQESPGLVDEALRRKIVVCSPSTLYAVLAVVRQAMDNYALEKSTKEILKLMEIFMTEWQAYGLKLDGLGKRIEAVQKEYHELAFSRRQRLDKPLEQFKNILKSPADKSGEHEES